MALPREHNEPSWITLTIEIPSYVSCKIGFCPVGPQRTGRIFEWAIAQLLCATILDMISTSCAYVWFRQVVHTRSWSDAHPCRRKMLHESTRGDAGPTTLWRRARVLSSRCWLISLASYSMMLPSERKNLSHIAWEIGIFRILAISVLLLVSKHNSSFEFSSAKSSFCALLPVMSPIFPLESTWFFQGKHLIHFLVLKMKELYSRFWRWKSFLKASSHQSQEYGRYRKSETPNPRKKRGFRKPCTLNPKP